MMYIGMYLLAIVLANASIATFGPTAATFNAFIFIAFDLTARDALHEAWHHDHLWLKMFALILTGSVLSAFLAPAIALASFTAFLAAGVSDALVYQIAYRQPQMIKMNGSNLVSSFVDSFVFIWLAFGNPILWGVVLSSYAAKIAGGLMWSLIITRFKQRSVIALG